MENECDLWIRRCDTAICMNLEMADAFDRGLLSVNILSQLRNLVDHICVKIFATSGGCLTQVYYNNITEAKKYVHGNGKYRFIKQLYDLLQVSVSHYTLEPENSERLMLKYYEYLLRVKRFLKSEYGMDILHNIDKFPLNTDPALSVYTIRRLPAKLRTWTWQMPLPRKGVSMFIKSSHYLLMVPFIMK